MLDGVETYDLQYYNVYKLKPNLSEKYANAELAMQISYSLPVDSELIHISEEYKSGQGHQPIENKPIST